MGDAVLYDSIHAGVYVRHRGCYIGVPALLLEQRAAYEHGRVPEISCGTANYARYPE
jgi:hypothetical protein